LCNDGLPVDCPVVSVEAALEAPSEYTITDDEVALEACDNSDLIMCLIANPTDDDGVDDDDDGDDDDDDDDDGDDFMCLLVDKADSCFAMLGDAFDGACEEEYREYYACYMSEKCGVPIRARAIETR